MITETAISGILKRTHSSPANTWHSLGAAQVMYLPPNRLTLRTMRQLIGDTSHDVLYLNSCFSVPLRDRTAATATLRFDPTPTSHSRSTRRAGTGRAGSKAPQEAPVYRGLEVIGLDSVRGLAGVGST